MLHALLHDLLALQDVTLLTTRDARLPPLSLDVDVLTVTDDVWPVWQQSIAEADAVWPIAPESGGVLERLVAMPAKTMLASTPPVVAIACSKYSTAQHLAAAGITVVPTWRPDEFNRYAGCFVAKPDDGVGCEDSWRFSDVDSLQQWMSAVPARRQTHVVQPWLAGEAASLSMLCRHGRAQLLSCNRQRIEVTDDGAIYYHGSLLNGMVAHWDAFNMLAQQLAQAFPSLAGYVGVDVMVDAGGLTVLEINPRLTTSYVGLHKAVGLNPAALVLALFYNGGMVNPAEIQRNVVLTDLDD